MTLPIKTHSETKKELHTVMVIKGVERPAITAFIEDRPLWVLVEKLRTAYLQREDWNRGLGDEYPSHMKTISNMFNALRSEIDYVDTTIKRTMELDDVVFTYYSHTSLFTKVV